VSWAQALSTLLIVGEILVYFLCVHKMNDNTALLAVYSAFGLIGIIAAILATSHNPTDWIVYYYKAT
jgi:hypothetical protein